MEAEEDRAQCQVDTVLVVKKYLETVCPSVGQTDMHNEKGKFKKGVPNISKGIGARQISKWLGKKN